LSVRIAAVCRGAAAFLMCHDLFPYLDLGMSAACCATTRLSFVHEPGHDESCPYNYSLMSLTSTAVKFWRWPREILY
jgi:hypothetical protein